MTILRSNGAVRLALSEEPAAAPKLAFMPQIDGLRAGAVALVLIHHFTASGTRFFPMGGFGVSLFFVISGFLITKLLLGTERSAGAYCKFYARRALRLLPLYYVIVLVLLLALQDVRDHWGYYVFHGVNFLLAIEQKWVLATPFWSLAVEEQFYVLWPALLLMLNQRAAVLVALAFVACAPLLRLAGALVAGANPAWLSSLLPMQVDCLGAGAAMALAGDRLAIWVRQSWFAVLAAVSFAATVALTLTAKGTLIAATIGASVYIPLAVWLVGNAAQGFNGPIALALSNPPVRYLGKISYGIYAIHIFAGALVTEIAPPMHLYAKALASTALTLVLAALSWRFFEGPINRWKERFR